MFKFISNDSNKDNVPLDYISEFEKKKSITFPDVLVDYYMNHNKAELKEVNFSIHNLEFSVEFLIPLKYGNVCVEKILSFNEGNEYISKTFIPLAEDIDGEDFYWDSSMVRFITCLWKMWRILFRFVILLNSFLKY